MGIDVSYPYNEERHSVALVGPAAEEFFDPVPEQGSIRGAEGNLEAMELAAG